MTVATGNYRSGSMKPRFVPSFKIDLGMEKRLPLLWESLGFVFSLVPTSATKALITSHLVGAITGVLAIVIGILLTVLTIAITVDKLPATEGLRTRDDYLPTFLKYNRSGLIHAFVALAISLAVLYVGDNYDTKWKLGVFAAWSVSIGYTCGSSVRIARILQRMFDRTLTSLAAERGRLAIDQQIKALDFSSIDGKLSI